MPEVVVDTAVAKAVDTTAEKALDKNFIEDIKKKKHWELLFKKNAVMLYNAS